MLILNHILNIEFALSKDLTPDKDTDRKVNMILNKNAEEIENAESGKLEDIITMLPPLILLLGIIIMIILYKIYM